MEWNTIWLIIIGMLTVIAFSLSIYTTFFKKYDVADMSEEQKAELTKLVGEDRMCTVDRYGDETCMNDSQIESMHKLGKSLHLTNDKVLVDSNGADWVPNLSSHMLSVNGSIGVMGGIGMSDDGKNDEYFIEPTSQKLLLRSTACSGASCPKIEMGQDSVRINTKLCFDDVCIDKEAVKLISDMLLGDESRSRQIRRPNLPSIFQVPNIPTSAQAESLGE